MANEISLYDGSSLEKLKNKYPYLKNHNDKVLANVGEEMCALTEGPKRFEYMLRDFGADFSLYGGKSDSNFLDNWTANITPVIESLEGDRKRFAKEHLKFWLPLYRKHCEYWFRL